MFKNKDIRMVKIGCFSGNTEHAGITNSKSGNPVKILYLELDENTLKYVPCVIIEEEQIAIDIFSGETYHIIKKDECDRILEPLENIENNTYYALTVAKEKLKSKSQIYDLYLNHMANKAEMEYKEKRNCINKTKTKKPSK